MRRHALPGYGLMLLVLATLLLLTRAIGAQQTVLQPSDVVYEGFRDVQTAGGNSTYGKALTHRYVNGQLRFLIIVVNSPGSYSLHEFAPGPLGGLVGSPTQTWSLPSGFADDWTGIWWEEARQRLWVTRSLDYGSASEYYPTRISVATLSGGSVTITKTFSLAGVSSKKVFGGAQALPAWAQAELGCQGKPYVVGWGGYASLVEQASKVSIGPTMYCIPEPDSVSNGATLSTGQFKTLLDTEGNRGLRASGLINQVDDNWQPQFIPQRPDGLWYWSWGDSFLNTGMWIEGETRRGFVAIASVWTGRVRYENGGVQADGVAFEMNVWNPSRLDDGLLTRPDSITVLNLPKANNRWWTDYGVGKAVGATYDAVSGRMYVLVTAAADDYTARLYALTVNAGGPVDPPPPPPPADADGDGVSDDTDACPTEPGPASNNGCPLPPPPTDTDGDGVPDAVDQCVDEPGPASRNGCPEPPPPPVDTDGDGIPDGDDACPTEPATTPDGCPEPDPDPEPEPEPVGWTATVVTVEPVTVRQCSGSWWWRRCTDVPTGDYRLVAVAGDQPPYTAGQSVVVVEGE